MRNRLYIGNAMKGFSVVEVILAAAIFVTFATAAIVAFVSGFNTNRLGAEVTIANQFNTEGMEAVRSIKNQSFAALAAKAGLGNQGAVVSGGVWTFNGTNNTLVSDSRFSRTISVSSVQRDGSGNIVASGGTVDASTYKVTVDTNWAFNSARVNSVQLTEYLTNWKRKKGGGLLVYGDGGTTTDAVKYRLFDPGTNTWGTATTAFDVDGSTTNKALRTIRIYSSKTRDEKIAISRHYNGTAQFIYATVWNGSSWGTPTQLSTWTATTFLDVLNFDGTYLNDGTFMVVYADNTIIPKYRTWDGTTWSAQGSLTTLGANNIPNFIIAQARPGTNEIMAAFFTRGSSATTGRAITQYWSGAAWSAITTHATAANANTKRMIDFAWSPNTPTTGSVIFADNSTDKSINMRVWVANGSGGGAWGSIVQASAEDSNFGAITIVGRPGANEFGICGKYTASPMILCLKETFSGSVATRVNPTNQEIATATDIGIQRSYDLDFESQSGNPAVIVYSDNTAIPKFKKYNASTTAWDAAATSVTTIGTPGVFKSVRIVPQKTSDDMLVLLSDANQDVFSIFWNGSANAMYTTPAGKAYTAHGTNGSATTDFWFDFAWDIF